MALQYDYFENIAVQSSVSQELKKTTVANMAARHKKVEIFVNGSLEGRATYYRSSGKRSVRGIYSHGARNGVWLYFEEDGNTIKKKEEYKDGKRVDKNKGDNVEKEPLKPISEDFLNPDIIMQQMGGNY